ncbi:4625_t:CDS:2, partial [Paraglomus occultum]
AKYNGLMTQGDKDYVNRIQISQLVTDDPYSDDFYFQVYAALRNRQNPNMGTFSPSLRSGGSGYGGHGGYERGRHRSRGSDNGLLKMQQQLLRIVQDAKRKPKLTQLSLEGALGKITINSVRNPRQLLQVSSKHEPSHHPGTSSASTHQRRPSLSLHGAVARKKVLRAIENVYSAVLKLEELRRTQPNRSRGYGGENEKEAFEN